MISISTRLLKGSQCLLPLVVLGEVGVSQNFAIAVNGREISQEIHAYDSGLCCFSQ